MDADAQEAAACRIAAALRAKHGDAFVTAGIGADDTLVLYFVRRPKGPLVVENDGAFKRVELKVMGRPRPA